MRILDASASVANGTIVAGGGVTLPQFQYDGVGVGALDAAREPTRRPPQSCRPWPGMR